MASDPHEMHGGGALVRVELLEPNLDEPQRLGPLGFGRALDAVGLDEPLVAGHERVDVGVVLFEPVPRLHVEDEARTAVLEVRGLRVAHEVLVHDVVDERAAQPVVLQWVVASLEHAPAVLQEVLHALDVLALPVASVELLFDDLGEDLGRDHRRFTGGVREDDRLGQLVHEVRFDVLDTARNHRRGHPGLPVAPDYLGVVLAPVRALVDGHVVVEPLPLVLVVRLAVLLEEPVDGVDELNVAGVAGLVLFAEARVNLFHSGEGNDCFFFSLLLGHLVCASLRIKKAPLGISTREGCQWVDCHEALLLGLFSLGR